MRVAFLLTTLLCWSSSLQAQGEAEILSTSSRSWSSGDPSPLPVRIEFFSSRPANALDSTSVKHAAETALLAVGLPPAVSIHSVVAVRAPQQLHLQVEVNVYSGGEVRLELRPMEGTRPRGCHYEYQWTSGDPTVAALLVSHHIRSAIECLQTGYGIEW